METVFEDPYILMTTKPISHPQDLMPTLDAVMKKPRPLVILAEKVDGGALGMLVREQPAPHARGGRRARARASATGASSTSATSPRSPAAQVIAEEAGLTLAHVKPRVPRRARGASSSPPTRPRSSRAPARAEAVEARLVADPRASSRRAAD